jgi:ATP-dependent helicase/DNAse subunit B
MKELIVYPTPYLVKQHNRLWLEGKKGVTGEYPVTYEIFIQKCIEEVTASKKFLGDFKKNILVNRIFRKLKKQNNLKYFDVPRQGYIHRISEVIGELKQQDIDAETFESMTEGKPYHRDLALIYRTYQDFLSKNSLYDQEDRYILCKENILKSEYVALRDIVCFREFYELSPIQQKILDALDDKARTTNSDLISKMKKIKVIKAQNRRTEIMLLAQTIVEDLGGGLLPDNMCIVLRNRDVYEHLLHEIFEELGIPICLEKQAALVQNPFIKALQRIFVGELTDYFSEEMPLESIENQTIGEWTANLVTFLGDRGYPERFCDIHDNDLVLIKRDLEAFESLSGLLSELKDMDRVISEETIAFVDFANLLGFYLQSRIYNYSPPKDGIWVLPPAMLRGLKFDKIYVPGMVEGEFPRDFRPDWLLKDRDRFSFNSKGYDFDTLNKLLEKERESFDFLTASSSTGYFSYPKVLEDNTSSLMSSYLEELLHLSTTPVENVRFESVYCPKTLENIVTEPGVISVKTKQRLKQHFFKKPFSVTAFNMYGECPYKFFLARVLNLSPPDEEGEYTALARGTVLHKILELFFKNHREGFEPTKLDEYTNEINVLTDEIMEISGVRESFLHPLLFEIEKEEIANNIINYLIWHMAQEGDFKPVFFELGFGYKKGFFLEFAPDILLSGKIDRIDEDSEGRFVVFDYKTGFTPDIKQVEEGTNLQLPLYIMASEQLLKKPVVGGAFISMRKGSVDNILVRDRNLPFVSKRRKKGILSQEEWEDLMETVKTTIRAYADNIREARFPMEPKKCPKTDMYGSFCDFTGICPWEGETDGVYS